MESRIDSLLNTLQSIANRIEGVMGAEAIIAVDDMRQAVQQLRSHAVVVTGGTLEEIEKTAIAIRCQRLQKKAHIANSLGIQRSTLDRKLKRYDIQMEKRRD